MIRLDRVVAVSVAVLAFGCTTVGMNKHGPLTAQEEADLARAMQTPLVFDVPSAEAQDAWGRAQSFVQRFSRMKIQTATDYVIETYNVNCASGEPATRYTANRAPGVGGMMRFDLNAMACWIDPDQNKVNAHVFAHYVKTGEMVCDREGFNACVMK